MSYCLLGLCVLKYCVGGDDLPDYKELYLSLFRANEKAIRLLIDAQQKAEEAILREEERGAVISILDHHGEKLADGEK